MKTKTIAICNQKGGVGKTTTTVNLGVGLAKEGKKVLLIDCDPQGNLTTSLGFDVEDPKMRTLSDALIDTMQEIEIDPKSLILHHKEGVDLIPANISLAMTETNLVTAMSRETTLKRFLATIDGSYDYILIDCLPSLGMLMQNALAASNLVLVPVVPQFLSATGMMQLFETIRRVKKHINSELNLLGIVLTIVDKRTKLSKETVKALRENLGDIKIYDSQIPLRSKAAEAPLSGGSIFEYAGRSDVAQAYMDLTKEVLNNG